MTTRQFKLYGIQNAPGSTGTISIDGNTVLSGAFSGDTTVETSILASGNLTFADEVETIKPVSLTVTTGEIQVGLFEWNYAQETNRKFTPEEIAIMYDYSQLVSTILALNQSKADTPYTAEELAKFDPTDITFYNKILTSTNAQMSELGTINYQHGVGPQRRYADSWSLNNNAQLSWSTMIQALERGPTPQEQDAINASLQTRATPILDGVEVAGAYENKYITVSAGSTLTWQALVFPNDMCLD